VGEGVRRASGRAGGGEDGAYPYVKAEYAPTLQRGGLQVMVVSPAMKVARKYVQPLILPPHVAGRRLGKRTQVWCYEFIATLNFEIFLYVLEAYMRARGIKIIMQAYKGACESGVKFHS